MAKQLNTVNLTFNADTGKARQQLMELQKMLDSLVKGSVSSSAKGEMPITKQLTEAQVAASKLQTILKQTTNANTGNLDLTRFSESLNKSGLDLKQLQGQLNSLGADGQKAFISLASSIVSADVPLTRTSKLVTELWTTLKNTARWQLSSSMLHGFMGTIQSAYGYAQDLDQSLNNIRIVTGQNVEEMARFAEQANKAAKALSTTTTNYTDASLIYYQQGLDENQVVERTEVTIKMANAAGQSAEVVSDQLTAVWNNFYDGSKSLEYYADVMTALGAATASSTDEIAGGLEKFAAVADTIGLSYEYAASALATITSNTRQSEEVVGTALKTIFARIQGLNLGETLDDGTTLNKYSEALDKVGISIFNQAGEIKAMDDILDEMGSKWDTMAKDQQIALAQTVAGVRQYNQLVSLMDNWDAGDSDSMMANLETAYGSTGALTEQADIYAESWQAARDRVKAAAEDIYDSLLDEKFFIGMLDGFETVLTGVGNLIDSLGGLPGVLTMVGAIMTRVFSQQMTTAINNMVFAMKSLSGETQRSAEEMKTKFVTMSENIHFDTGTEAGDREGEALQGRLDLTKEITKASELLTAEEREQLANILQINDAYAEQMVLAAKSKDKALQNAQEQSSDMRLKIGRAADKGGPSVENFKSAQQELKEFAENTGRAKASLSSLKNDFRNKDDIEKFNDSVERVKKGLDQIGQTSKSVKLDQLWKNLKDDTGKPGEAIEKFKNELKKLIDVEDFVADSTQQMSDKFHETVAPANITITECDELTSSFIDLGEATQFAENSHLRWNENLQNVKNSIRNFNNAVNTLGADIVKISQGLSSMLMGISSLKGAWDALSNPDLSFGEKTFQVLQSLTMAIPSLVMGYKALTEVKWKDVKAGAVKLAQGTQELVQDGAKLVMSTLRKNALLSEALAAITASKAYQKLNLAKHATLKSTLILVAAIAALVAIVASIVAIFNAVSDAYNKDALAAERAQEAAKNLASEYENTKQAYEEMISAMDNYKSATDALENMTKGTEEYRDALKEANEAALDLIAANNLTKEDYNWEDGQLKIEQEALDRVKEEQSDQVSEAYAASQMANVRASEAQNQADFTQIKRDMVSDSLDVVTGTTATTGQTAEALQKALDYMAEKGTGVLDDKDLIQSELEINDQGLINALYENRGAIEELSGSIESADALREAATQQAANEIMAGEGYEETQAGRAALEASGRVYEAKEQAAYDKYMKTNLADLEIGTAAGKQLWADYAKEAGLEDLDGLKLDYENDRVKYEYIDEEGNKQEKEVTKEQIAQTLAAANAADGLKEAMSTLQKEIASLSESANKADKALAKFLSSENLEKTTKEEYDKIKKAAQDDEGNITDASVEAYLDKEFGNGEDGKISDATAQKYGFNDAEEMVAELKASLEVEWKTLPESLNKEIADALTLGATEDIANTYEEMGKEGGSAYVATMNEAFEAINWDNLEPDEVIAAQEALAGIDWKSWDAGKQAANIVREYGGAIDTTTESWQKNIRAMRDATDAVPNLETLGQTLNEIAEISSDIELGSILTKEDYDTLINYNSELERYFTILTDGSAQFTGDPLDFAQEIKTSKQQELREAIQASIDQSNDFIEQYNKGIELAGSEDNVNLYRLNAENIGDQEWQQDFVQQQLAFLESQNYDSDKLSSWKENIENNPLGTIDSLQYYQIAEAVNETANAFGNLKEKAEQAQAASQTAMNELALSADDADERLEMFNSGDINEVAYTKAFESAHNAEKWEGLDAEEVEEYADSLMEAAESSELLSDKLKDNEEAAEDVAAYTKKMNRGIESLSEGFDDWSDVLKKSDKSSEEYADAMGEMKSAMSDVLGVSEDFLSDDFILQNMEDIKKAAEGDAEAIDRLAIAASRDILINLDFADENVKEEVLGLHDELSSMIPDIEVGAVLKDGDFLAKAANIVETAGMTVEQANAYFRSMGFEPTFETKSVPVTRTLKGTKTYTTGVKVGEVETSSGPFKYIAESTTRTEEVDMGTATEMVEVPALTTDGGKPNFTLTRTNAGAMNNSSSSNRGGKKSGGGGGGGGGSSAKPEKVDKTKKSDVVERYKEIEDKLDDVRNAMEDVSRAADRLYGANRIKKMKDVSKQLEKEVKLLNQKKEEAEEYLEIDKKALKNAAKDVGLTFKFDDEGNISNYEAQMEKLYNKLAKAEAKADPKNFKTKEAQDAYIEKNVTPLKEKIEALKEAIEQYDETRELIEDLDDEAEEKFNEWQDNNFEILNYELELKLEVDDSELRRFEYLLSKIEDDFYSMAEAAALMIGNAVTDADGNVTGLDTTSSQLKVYEDQFADLQAQRDALKTAYQNGEISEAQYVEGLQDLEDKAYDNAEAIQELDKTMMHYYGDTLEAAADELSKYTDMMEQHTEVLEHYANIMDIIGKSTDYESMGVILEAQADVARNSLDVSKANYEMLNEQRNARKAEYEAAIGTATDEELAVLKQKWLDAEAAANDAQDQMMADAEAWAEALRAVVENKLAGLAQTLEDSLTADFGGSFDQMAAQMERAASLQEEYLTDTNKIYETNKLINKAQQDIDKTTNTVAKKRLQNYIKETEQLQNKAKLSNYELEIQQAKYDLVLAEIALEEAQNAKSTVRLQRDAEGNFGYVYTADSSKVAEAEQQLADAQNRLYNIGLEGANSYTEKYQQTLAEMYDTLTELQTQYLEGAFASEEEYNQAVENAKAYYYEKLEQYSELYSIALTTDAAVREDAWGSSFEKMTLHTGDWQAAVTKYLGNVKSVFAEWEKQVKAIREETIGPDLDALKEKTKAITEANDKLEESVTKEGGVLDAIKAEIEQVDLLTKAYAKARAEIAGSTTAHEDFIESLRESIENPEKDKPKEPEKPKEEEPKQEEPKTEEPKETVDNSEKAEGVAAAIWIDGNKSGWGNDPGRKKKLKEKGVTEAQTILNTKSMDNLYSKWINKDRKKYYYGSFDTGGYTGDWGSQGKLAILHEKELVLNKQDTANFLASMDILHKILNTIDLQAMSSQIGGFLSSPRLGQMKEELLEQHVTIEANFPGVSVASEIEEAFGNLVNLASQYANRK